MSTTANAEHITHAADLRYDAAGLVTVVAQDRASGTIRMVAHANREAVEATLQTGRATFWSRSRQSLWIKGESSGHTMDVHAVWADCDGDALVYLVDPAGPSCHTLRETCFFRPLPMDASTTSAREGGLALPVLAQLEKELKQRRDGEGERSYTRSLLKKGPSKIGEKIREEADELAAAIAEESDERVASEAGDLVYHLMVGLIVRGIPRRNVENVLAARFGISGIDEKASRSGDA